MKELIRKKYVFPIRFKTLFSRKGKIILFEYQQATLAELLEMGQTITNQTSLTAWLYNFLSKNAKNGDKITMRMFAQMKAEHLNKIVSHLLETYAKGYFREATKQEKENAPKQKAPDSSFFALIFEHSNETAESLLKLTWEQIEYIIDGITWNLRGQTKEGQAENRRQWALRESRSSISDKDALERVKQLEKRLATKKINYATRERTI